MAKKNNSLRRAVSSSVLFGFLAILLCAPNVRADVIVPSGETMDIDYDVQGVLDIFGTANLYQGAYAANFIYAYPGAVKDEPGSTVNIYGCAPLNTLWVLDPTTSQWPGLPPVVTVYGSRFIIGQIETGTSFYPPDDRIINGTLNVLDESDELLFSICIFTDVEPIHLRAPGSTEEERLEAELCISPKLINRQRRWPQVFASLRLPEGITKDDVDNDCRLVLYADDNEIQVEASCQRIYQPCRRHETSRVKIFAFFNIGMLLEALPDNCEEAQIQVCGKLKSGQEFYGSDNIKIVSPPRKHWTHWNRRSSKYGHR